MGVTRPKIAAASAASAGSKGNSINDIEPSLKVWVGKLPEGVDSDALQAHFGVVGTCTRAEVLPRGVACVAFDTAEEATTAIASLNGTQLGGAAIQVDTWEQKPAKPKSDKGKSKGKGKGGVWQSAFEKP